MTNEELASLIREVVTEITPGDVSAIEQLRPYATTNCHVGRWSEMDHTDAGYRLLAALMALGVGPWEKSFADLCAAVPERSGTTADERDARWVALLDAANAYLLTDAANGFMVVLQDKKTWFGLGTKAQFSIMLDGRSGLQLEQAEVTRPAPAGNSSGAPSDCRMTGGICACRSGGSFGGCAKERANCCTSEPTRHTAHSPKWESLSEAAQQAVALTRIVEVCRPPENFDIAVGAMFEARTLAARLLARPAAPARELTAETLAQHVKDWFPDRSYQAQFFAEAVMKGELHHSKRHLSGATPARKEG